MLRSKAFVVDGVKVLEHSGMSIVGVIFFSESKNSVTLKVDGVVAIRQPLEANETICWSVKLFLEGSQELRFESIKPCSVVVSYDGDE